ncbi:hypothetical protein L602_002600000880 [Cupriavidus gilardii J11]|uniref:DUF3299 domain-containing protein n=1 Tax=Cupriavidus gilardii J11 TaxID=936133 RepID=A0A562BJD0_9BURK|nr:DUF3299 domain-containing protein [Cupriavidus gilardii]TWG85325.1 hypothetical protein L602_002600000880 [Cupriavidus gilardii J11]
MTNARIRKWLLAAGAGATLAAASYAYWALRIADRPTGSVPTAANAADASRPYAIGESIAPRASAGNDPGQASQAFREIDWEALLPKGWDPMAPLRGLNLAELQDDDPRAQEALDKAKRYWQEAPIEPTLDGAPVRLPGFVVSLGGEGEALREFLLVPYFGACIHLPPPPVNQVVHVRTSAPVEGIHTMDTVWIEGVLNVERAETAMGDSGYAMRGARVTPYHERAR